MPIRIDKTSEVSIREQLRQQIIFGIATGEYPIGYEMPSVRTMATRHKIHHNTVSQVYGTLVEQRWLVRQRGRTLVVVHPTGPPAKPVREDLETLLERVVQAAQIRGVTPEELMARIQRLAAVQVPDHFVIVEPEPGIGKVLRYEVGRATGQRAMSYSIPQLREHPELIDGSALLVPAYLADLMDFVSARQRAEMTLLTYAPFSEFVERVRKLANPSVIGMVSVSGPGMKTMEGVFAESLASRHRLAPFLLEVPVSREGKVVIRKLERTDLPPDVDVRVLGQAVSAEGTRGGRPVVTDEGWASHLPIVTEADLLATDVLFTESITDKFVRHPRKVMYRLLSDASLREIGRIQLRA